MTQDATAARQLRADRAASDHGHEKEAAHRARFIIDVDGAGSNSGYPMNLNTHGDSSARAATLTANNETAPR